MERKQKFICTALIMMLVGCHATSETIPPKATLEQMKEKNATVSLERNEEGIFDFRCADVSALNLSSLAEGWEEDLTFDNHTIWPADFTAFQPKIVLNENQYAGYHLHQLHESGINGEGIGIAVIGRAVLQEHEAYAHSFVSVQEDHEPNADFFSTQLVSLLVGEKTGIAPNAKVYYFAQAPISMKKEGEMLISDVEPLVQSLEAVLAYNETIKEHKIRMVVMMDAYFLSDREFAKKSEHADELAEEIAKAKEMGIAVFSPSIDNAVASFGALRKELNADGDEATSYRLDPDQAGKNYYVPASNKTLASSTGKEDYAYVGTYGSSLLPAYVAGLYALSLQEHPELTLEAWMNQLNQASIELALPQENGQPINLIDPLKLVK